MNSTIAKNLALKCIKSFPKSKNGKHYLKCLSGEKIFFHIFNKKYGLKGEEVKYKNIDIVRRIRMVESFLYFLKSYNLTFDTIKNGQKYFLIETYFFTFVIIQTRNQQYELLSFYPK